MCRYRNKIASAAAVAAAVPGVLTGRAKGPSSHDLQAVQRWLQTLQQPFHQDSLRGTADVLGSPVLSGKLGNGPGVGFSGAGTQQNFGGAKV